MKRNKKYNTRTKKYQNHFGNSPGYSKENYNNQVLNKNRNALFHNSQRPVSNLNHPILNKFHNNNTKVNNHQNNQCFICHYVKVQ